MSPQPSSTPSSLYRHLVLLLVFPSLILCISDVGLQNRQRSVQGLSLFPRAVPNPSDPMNFDDMPSCARENCIPYNPETIGCPEGELTRECYCGSADPLKCQRYKCDTAQDVLAQKWLALTCTGFGFDQLNTIPACASECLLADSVASSCSLKSWDCLCAADLPSTCLKTCSSTDIKTVKAWKADQCARAQPNVKPEGSTNPLTTTIPPKLATYTLPGGNLVTSTIAPAVTTVVNANTNGNTNTINVQTGSQNSAPGLVSGLAMYDP